MKLYAVSIFALLMSLSMIWLPELREVQQNYCSRITEQALETTGEQQIQLIETYKLDCLFEI